MDIAANTYKEAAEFVSEEPNKVRALIAVSRGSERDEWTCLPGVAEALYQVADMVDDYLARMRP